MINFVENDVAFPFIIQNENINIEDDDDFTDEEDEVVTRPSCSKVKWKLFVTHSSIHYQDMEFTIGHSEESIRWEKKMEVHGIKVNL